MVPYLLYSFQPSSFYVSFSFCNHYESNAKLVIFLARPTSALSVFSWCFSCAFYNFLILLSICTHSFYSRVNSSFIIFTHFIFVFFFTFSLHFFIFFHFLTFERWRHATTAAESPRRSCLQTMNSGALRFSKFWLTEPFCFLDILRICVSLTRSSFFLRKSSRRSASLKEYNGPRFFSILYTLAA
jgi:hypothetical protein